MTDPLTHSVLAEGERRRKEWKVEGHNRHAWEQWTLVHGEALLAVARDQARLTAENDRLRNDIAVLADRLIPGGHQ